MNNKEKDLILDLFTRLKKAEKSSSERDKKAENFIQDCLKKQPNAIYYIIQTVLVQEIAIKNLNNIIKKLKDKEKEISNNSYKKSFLSGLLEKYIPSNKNNKLNNNSNLRKNFYSTNNSLPSNKSFNENFNSSLGGTPGSFLGNALQTAAGVAGGMIAGNMLMNLFHKNNGEDIFNNTENNFFIEDSQDLNNLDFSENSLKKSSLQNQNDLDNFDNTSIDNSFKNDSIPIEDDSQDKNISEDIYNLENEDFVDDNLDDDNEDNNY
ncbi:MAG: DUF2076 domain-containing protein [Buchnera aphidicola (Periphyllus aceris)]|nr:DUF2076 domain-containing protein [Buchnera aphidicola (Periphyllus aceris)]